MTFVVHNGGKLVHGFEMEIESGDSSGSGSGDEGFKIERPTFDPGETIRVRMTLAPGVYKVECFVANHDDLGMEALLEVSRFLQDSEIEVDLTALGAPDAPASPRLVQK